MNGIKIENKVENKLGWKDKMQKKIYWSKNQKSWRRNKNT